jgi:Tfp pilus assembly ATPase PilU
MNQCLLRYVKAGIITEQEALANAGQFTELKQLIRMAINQGQLQPPTQAA